MRPRVLITILILTGSPPPAMAERTGSLSGSLWVGVSGLQVKLTEDGDQFILRAEHGGLFGDWFSGISTGTVVLRARRFGDEISGTAYAFAPGCVFPYRVRGSISDTRIAWSGQEPKDKAANTCRAIRTEFVETSVQLKWAPSPPAHPPSPPAWVPPPPVPPIVKASPPPRRDAPVPSYLPDPLSVEIMVAIGAAAFITFVLGTFGVRWAYLKLMAVLTDARLALAEKRSRLAAMPAPPSSGSRATLSLTEIMELVEQMPDASPELRATLRRLLELRLQEKSA